MHATAWEQAVIFATRSKLPQSIARNNLAEILLGVTDMAGDEAGLSFPSKRGLKVGMGEIRALEENRRQPFRRAAVGQAIAWK
jgi:hypothetical protein